MLLRVNQLRLRALCAAQLAELPERAAPHFDTALELVLSKVQTLLRDARLVPGASSGMIASALEARLRADDRAACARILERAVPARGRVSPVLGVVWLLVACAALWALSLVSPGLAIAVGSATVVGAVLAGLIGWDTVQFFLRLAGSRRRRTAMALSAEVRSSAETGDPAGEAYTRLAELASEGDPIIGWAWAQAIEAAAPIDDGPVGQRAFEDLRHMIVEDRVPPGAGPALVRALVATADRRNDTLRMLGRLLVIAPEVGTLYREARAAIERRDAESIQ